MDWQWVADGAFTIVGILLTVLINSTRDSIKELHKQDSDLADKVQSIEILVAGNYVKRTDMDSLSVALFAKLDKIENKLDRKVDK